MGWSYTVGLKPVLVVRTDDTKWIDTDEGIDERLYELRTEFDQKGVRYFASNLKSDDGISFDPMENMDNDPVVVTPDMIRDMLETFRQEHEQDFEWMKAQFSEDTKFELKVLFYGDIY